MLENKDKRSNKKITKPKLERRIHFSIWYFLFAIIIFSIFESILVRPDVQKITYSEFKKFLAENKIRECAIAPDKIEGTMFVGDSLAAIKVTELEKKIHQQKQTDRNSTFRQRLRNLESEVKDIKEYSKYYANFETIRVDDPKLTEELELAKVEFMGKPGTSWFRNLLLFWILPVLLLFGLWGFIFRRMNPTGGMMAIGKSKAKIYVEGQTKVTFKDVAGVDEAKEEVNEIVEFLKNPEKFARLGGRIPKGVLLVGPPGTGKTLLAKAVAGEAKVPFFSMSGSDFVEMFVGVGAARVRDLFQQASQKAPCIIFIDELDALGKARGMSPVSGHDEREQTLNQLLSEMDGFDSNSGVIIMGATNRPEILDMALLRPGRFDRQIVVDRPDINGREAILQVHSRNVKLAEDVDLRVIAGRTPGFAGADLANVINEAALLAARNGKKKIEMSDLEEAIDRVIAGLERKSRVMNKREKETVAYHEAGHALVAASLPDCDPVHRVSIIPRGVAALGYTLQLPTEDRYLMTRSELINKLRVLLGGRVAEEIVYSEISTGALNDLERATEIARSMVTEYGMSSKIGPVFYGRGQRSLFLGQEFPGRDVFSERVASEIDAEVRAIIETCYADTKKILTEKRDNLEKLARRLLEVELVEGEALNELLGLPNKK